MVVRSEALKAKSAGMLKTIAMSLTHALPSITIYALRVNKFNAMRIMQGGYARWILSDILDIHSFIVSKANDCLKVVNGRIRPIGSLSKGRIRPFEYSGIARKKSVQSVTERRLLLKGVKEVG